MQLIENWPLRLNNGDSLEIIVPEPKEVQVLQEGGICETKSKTITLWMLLTHDSGFGYSVMNKGLRDYSFLVGVNGDWSFPAGINGDLPFPAGVYELRKN